MTVQWLRGMVVLGMGVLLASAVWAAPRALNDTQLDQVYAAGFDVTVDFDVDIAASKPESVFVEGGSAAAFSQLLNQGMTIANSRSSSRNSGSFDPTGSYMPNLQNLVVNNINISENALKNATTMMNVFALEGDVAIGLNLNVVVNPTNTNFTVQQTNVNWGTLNLADSL